MRFASSLFSLSLLIMFVGFRGRSFVDWWSRVVDVGVILVGHVRHWLRDFFDFNWVWFSCGYLEIDLMGYQGIGCDLCGQAKWFDLLIGWVPFGCCCMVIMWLCCHELGWSVVVMWLNGWGDLFLIDLLYVKLEWWTSCDGIGWGSQISFDRIIMFLEIGWVIRQLSQF